MNAVDLGALEVVADPAEIAAFRSAARLAGDGVPFTYPIRWLASPPLRTAVMALVPEPDLVPFHESQSFDYARRLEVGATYRLTVAARREGPPDRLVIESRVAGIDGALVATSETVLRLLSTAQAAA